MKLRKLTTPIFLMGMAFSAASVQAATISYMFGLPVVETTVSIDRFGESGPYPKVAEHLGMTAAALVKRLQSL